MLGTEDGVKLTSEDAEVTRDVIGMTGAEDAHDVALSHVAVRPESPESDGTLTLTRPSDNKEHRAMHGLYRALVHNMVVGVTDGFAKTLEMVGTGYHAEAKDNGKKLDIAIGFSHPVILDAPENVTFETPNQTTMVIKGIDKQVVGSLAADIRAIRPPEPYLGKGIKYQGEHILRKEGKAGKK